MKKTVLMILVSILVITGIGLCTFMIADATDVPSVEEGTALTVTGEGTVTATPDTATVNIGVMTTGDTAADTQAQNSLSMQKVLNALKAMGIKDEDIVTASYSIYPQYNYESDTRDIIGYQVSNSLSVTLHDIDSVGKVLEAATAAGANTAGSISFSSSQADALYNQALVKAYAAAKAKGQVLADATGLKVKGLISVSEGVDYAGAYAKTTSYFSAEESAGVPIETGQLTFSATVTAVYNIK